MSDQLWSKGLPVDEQTHAFTVGDDPLVDLELLPFDIEGSAAHARMLGECGLLPEVEAKALVATLHSLKKVQLPITREQEDCHTALEHALAERLGDTGRSIHLGRSRNDQVQTALRLLMREKVLDIGQALLRCAVSFVALAKRYGGITMPGYTHMRRAMPSNWEMWAGAFAEGLLEELEQLPALWSRLDRCPLGAAAGFGSPVAINRERTAELLGFSDVQWNPIDVMNSRGRNEQAIAAWIVSATATLEKAIWDLLIWSTEEFGFVRLADAFTTGSSLMPQKRNPDVLELARARCRELRGLAVVISNLASGLPSGYHRDQQLLKAPFLQMLRTAQQLFEMLARLIPALEIDVKRCAAACTPEIYAASEACRQAAEGVPFRDAYQAVAQQIRDGSFVAKTAPDSKIFKMKKTEADLAKTESWLAERRAFVATTRERLFDWK